MRLTLLLLLLTAPFLCLAQTSPRKTRIDTGWRFHYGDLPEASAPDFDDTAWRAIDLPHDWSVETEAAAAADPAHVGPFVREAPAGPSAGFTVGGVGWYRRTFTLSARDLAGRVMLYFEGAYNHSEVWLNGQRVYFNHYGYQSFRFDITEHCRPAGQPNVLAVKVSNEGLNTRWYAGSGIYRHVWLLRYPTLHLDDWDTFYRTAELRADRAVLSLSTVVKNEGDTRRTETFEAIVRDAKGKVVARASTPVSLAPHASRQLHFRLPIRRPNLWWPARMDSLGTPYLYKAEMRLGTDRLTHAVGLRTIEVSAERGLLINGARTWLYGGCLHHDNGLLGAAAYDAAEDRKLTLVRAQGFNAVRTSHNMPSDHFLDACDSLGLMVVDENFDQWLRAKNPADYHLYFKEHSVGDLQTMVRRDRNHPSIVLWSIGNEIPGRIEPEGLEAARTLREAVLQLDTTRPITAAIPEWDDFRHPWSDNDSLAFQSLDVGGYNYMYYRYPHDHATHPRRVMVGLESYPKRASESWEPTQRTTHVIGDFVWTAMDYLGEAGIGSAAIRTSGQQPFSPGWPWFNGFCGDIDLIGEKKPQSYYRDIVWKRRPVAMAVARPVPEGSYESVSQWGWQLEEQSWTFSPDMQGQLFSVNVYSRAPKVRLYLNGALVGEQATGPTFWAGFSVPYQPGTLRAVNLDENGREMGGDFQLVTTTQPVALRLRADRRQVSTDPQDLAYVTAELVDAEGRVVRESELHVTFTVTGQGRLLAAGNASPNDMASFRSPSPRLYNGQAQAIVKSGGERGAITVSATAAGFETATLTVPVTRKK